MSETKPDWKHTTIIVGSGLAGLCAAIEAYEGGSQLVIFEKNSWLGGNSSLASSGINAVNTKAQQEAHAGDSIEDFLNDTIKCGAGGHQSKELVEHLVKESTDAAHFLESRGVDLSLISQCGGHSHPRTHRAKQREDGKLENIGRHITSKLIAYLQSLPRHKVRIYTNSVVQNLLQNKDGHVVGLRYSIPVENEKDPKEVNMFGDCVILACGGYCADRELLKEFCAEEVYTLPTTNGPWAQGEGIKIARNIGADLVDMDKVQIHPTGIVDLNDPFALKKWLAPEALRGCGGILLNSSGTRFVNELDQRDHVSAAIFKNGQQLKHEGELKEGQRIPTIAFLILNDEAAEQFDIKMFNFYKSKNLIHTVANSEELANFMKADHESIKKTLEEYNAAKEKGEDQFAKKLFPVKFSADKQFHIVVVTPSIHYSMGGLKINEQSQVLKEGKPISGLYAAGEVTGGVHGGQRLAGNSLLECVVFGRRAGRTATAFKGFTTMSGVSRRPDFVGIEGVEHKTALYPDKWIPLQLRDRNKMNSTSFVFSFALPSPTDQAGLLAGQYVAVRALLGGEQVVRYYSPISRNSQFGRIDLLVKIEVDKCTASNMTGYLRTLEVGNTLEFQGPLGGFEYHRNAYREVGMLAGGCGISPMMQIIRSVIGNPQDNTNIRLLYGNYVEDDILCKEELLYVSSTRTNINAWITLNEPPAHWSMSKGFITEEMMKQHLPPPAEDIKIIMCGPPAMIKAMIPALKNIGYTDEMMFSYV